MATNMDEAEMLDLLKRIMAQVLMNSGKNVKYAVIEKLYPDIVMSLHAQSSYLKKYSFYILSQILSTEHNRGKNSLMPINNLQKDCKSSDKAVHSEAIIMLGNMV